MVTYLEGLIPSLKVRCWCFGSCAYAGVAVRGEHIAPNGFSCTCVHLPGWGLREFVELGIDHITRREIEHVIRPDRIIRRQSVRVSRGGCSGRLRNLLPAGRHVPRR